MSLLTSALRALGFIDTPGKTPPPGALDVDYCYRIMDWHWEPSKMAPDSCGLMWILWYHKSNGWPIVVARRCRINRKTGKWTFRDVIGGLGAYRRCPIRFMHKMRPDCPSRIHTGFGWQVYLHENWDEIQYCIKVADAHGRAPGVCHHTWMMTPKDRRHLCRPAYGW